VGGVEFRFNKMKFELGMKTTQNKAMEAFSTLWNDVCRYIAEASDSTVTLQDDDERGAYTSIVRDNMPGYLQKRLLTVPNVVTCLAKHGDLLAALRNVGETPIKIHWRGGFPPTVIPPLSFIQGDFTWIMPKINNIEGDVDHIRQIWVIFPYNVRNDIRRLIWKVPFGGTDMYVHWDCILPYPNDPSMCIDTSKLPSSIDPERLRKERAMQRMYVIEKELIERTWHPSRFLDWCIPYDEIRECNQ
jgi:hypothetical protein